jgi:hypothetical protein
MDDPSFDTLAKRVASGSSRRDVIKVILGSAAGGALSLAGALGLRDVAAACKGYLQSCKTGTDCCSGYCHPNKRCNCPPNTAYCSGNCVAKSQFQSDINNCGSCGKRCRSDGACVNGICTLPACAPAGGYGPGLSTGPGCEAITFRWSAQPGTDFYVISIDGVAEPATTGTSLTKTGLPRKTSGSYRYCFQQGKKGCPDLSQPVCSSFNTRSCPTP